MKLLQYSPTIYEREEDEVYAISRESYTVLQEQQQKIEFESTSEKLEPVFLEDKVRLREKSTRSVI